MSGRWVLGLLAAALVGGALFGAGLLAGRALAPADDAWTAPFGFGMMGRSGMLRGGGMMGGFFGNRPATADPLSVEQATEAVEAFLADLDLDDLEVAEVMIFDNHAYVEVKDPSSGVGAIELLVDPATRAVFLEYGPSMMWNVEYGMMGRRGMHGGFGMMGGRRMGGGGMMGGSRWPCTTTPFDPASMTITPEAARTAAQAFLDEEYPGLTVAEEAETFPGYYTLHTLSGSEVEGMISVNGYSGQVWYHTWHGELLAVSEHEG